MRKRIAPIIIAVIAIVLVLLYAGTVAVVLLGTGPLMSAFGIIFAIAATIVAIALIVTLKKRLNEIKEDEENDYSQY